MPTKWERLEKTQAELAEAQKRMDKIADDRRKAQLEAEREGKMDKVQLLSSGAQKVFINSKRKHADPIVELEPDYQWKTKDYI